MDHYLGLPSTKSSGKTSGLSVIFESPNSGSRKQRMYQEIESSKFIYTGNTLFRLVLQAFLALGNLEEQKTGALLSL